LRKTITPNPAERIKTTRKQIKALEKRILDGTWIRDLTKNVGVACLSEKHNDILMWSHYAGNHTGFVIGFDSPISSTQAEMIELKRNSQFHLCALPVKYEKHRPTISGIAKSGREAQELDSLMLTKSDIWEYEAERRVIRQNGSGIFKINPKCIKQVLAGCKVGSDISLLEAAIRDFETSTGEIVEKFVGEIDKDNYQVNFSTPITDS
jgi:hypothetical protein